VHVLFGKLMCACMCVGRHFFDDFSRLVPHACALTRVGAFCCDCDIGGLSIGVCSVEFRE
jgi:hypothetical protein